MTYTPKVWAAGMSVLASDLNHLETQYDEGYAYLQASHHNTRYRTRTEFTNRYQQGDAPTGGDADTLELIHLEALAEMLDVGGMIGFWETGTAPAGYVICNGSNGAPDLRDRYIVISGGGYIAGQTGGAATTTHTGAITVAGHTLTVNQIPSHNHEYYDSVPGGGAYNGPNTGSNIPDTTSSRGPEYTDVAGGDQPHSHPSSVSINADNNNPPYKVLQPIMRII